MNPILHTKIPREVSYVTETLQNSGFEAYLIGGCTRDLILGKTPKDWDVTTNATPEVIIKIFPKTFYENDYGTVGVVNEETSDSTLKVIEVTPYRLEAGYSDKRRPDSVTWSKNLDDDLKRRDFTINAIALKVLGKKEAEIVDLYGGISDLNAKIIRTVGNPEERFGEDALRVLRAIRLQAELGFTIERETEEGIKNNVKHLKDIAKERISDEFSRILMSEQPMNALDIAHRLGVLDFIAPELEKAVGVEQNKAHSYDVFEHLLRSLQHAADKGWTLEIRLAALFHDISKPETRRWSDEKKEWTFYGHEVVGSRVTRKILENLRYPKEITEKVVTMVRWHMFFTDTEQITLSAVRRMVANVGKDNIWDLMNLRICDRVGTGRPKENPYRLRKYKSMIEEALRDPISVGMLKIDGNRIIDVTKTTPGPKIGYILHALLEEVLDDPAKNTSDYLEKRASELSSLGENELKGLGEKGKEKKEEVEEVEKGKIRKRHHVQ